MSASCNTQYRPWQKSRWGKSTEPSSRGAFKRPRRSADDVGKDNQVTESSKTPGNTDEAGDSTSTTEELSSVEDSNEEFEWDEEYFRSNMRLMLDTYGLELGKAWFNLEAIKCKKPRTP